IIVAISEDLVEPNTFYNEETTIVRQNEAAASVPIQERSFEQGQLIVRSGNIITELDQEALRQYGFLQSDGVEEQAVIGAFLAMAITTVMLGLYLDRFYPALLNDPQMLSLMAVLFLIFLGTINLFGEDGADQPYLYPSAALGLLLTTLFSPQLAIAATGFLAILVGITLPEDLSLQMAAYIMVGSIAGILNLRRLDRMNSYFFAGLVIGFANMIVVQAFALAIEDSPSLADVIVTSIIALGNGLFAAGIALVGLYVVTSLMNLPTSLKMLELMDSKQPLLQQLLREAPGTYQHSLQVANLAELAAEAIGANDQLIRVAAMYHDIGKMLNPYYFVENTAEGMTPHEDLNDPTKSAKVIIGHVIEGERMARRANLPQRIRDFILEHHGTTQ
ncbi:MAG TPA: HDIG domain-containing protein, partial [Aggregatilineales bacterium]|nr:HDIG domain-containing protein [Aggregatilineales bacterium]